MQVAIQVYGKLNIATHILHYRSLPKQAVNCRWSVYQHEMDFFCDDSLFGYILFCCLRDILSQLEGVLCAARLHCPHVHIRTSICQTQWKRNGPVKRLGLLRKRAIGYAIPRTTKVKKGFPLSGWISSPPGLPRANQHIFHSGVHCWDNGCWRRTKSFLGGRGAIQK